MTPENISDSTFQTQNSFISQMFTAYFVPGALLYLGGISGGGKKCPYIPVGERKVSLHLQSLHFSRRQTMDAR